MICIFIDTNILNSGCKDFTSAHFMSKLDDITREIESNDYYGEVKILLAQIVIDELFDHQISEHDKYKETLKGLKLHNTVINIPDNYKELLTSIFKDALASLSFGSVKCEIVPYPPENSLQNIIKRSLERRAPFEGKDKKSDKGFKDVILWESILEYKRSNKLDTILLFSADKRICDISLRNEFKKIFSDEIFLICRENDNGNQQLFEVIAKLQKKQYQKTYSESLKYHLIELLENETLSGLVQGEPVFYENDDLGFTVDNVDILDKNIISVVDDAENQRIHFQISMKIMLSANDGQGAYTQGESKCVLAADYSFEDDTFYAMHIACDLLNDIDYTNGYPIN